MKTFLPIWLAIIAASSTQSHKIPYDRDLGFSLHQISLDFRLEGSFEQAGSIDFRNFTFLLFDKNTRVVMKGELKHGSYEEKSPAGFDSVKLDSLYFLPSANSNQQYILALYTWEFAGGSSNIQGVAEVYKLENHKLRVTQQIDWDEHFDSEKPMVVYDKTSGTLVARTAHYLPGDAHCCVSAVDVVTLRWDSTHFVRSGLRTELSNYGEREKKQL
jgi:hypothetical protein